MTAVKENARAKARILREGRAFLLAIATDGDLMQRLMSDPACNGNGNAAQLRTLSSAAQRGPLKASTVRTLCQWLATLSDPDRTDGASLLARAAVRVPETMTPEHRDRGIMPTQLTFPLASRPDPARLPAVPGPVPDGDAWLPGLEPDGPRPLPALLTLFDQGGGVSLQRGGIAPAELCIWLEALMAVPVLARYGGLVAVGPVTLRNIAGEWLQWNLHNYRERSGDTNGRVLADALRKASEIQAPLNDRGGWWRPLLLQAVEGLRLDDRVKFWASLPDGSGVGPQVNRLVLRALRRHVGAYRGYLALCFDLDKYGTRTNPKAAIGRKRQLILPSRPVAQRNARGHLLDARGRVITGRGGVPVTSPYDQRAILTGAREPNPARDRYPLYKADDLVRLCYPDAVFRDQNPAARRKRQERARHNVEMIEHAGGCTIERTGDSPHDGRLPWRLMPPEGV